MELLQLKYFLTIASMEHISKAAEMLYVSQPSLSKTISRLEKELGTPLFDRYSRNIKLNETGRIFLKHVERIFFELEEAQIEIKNQMRTHKIIIPVAATSAEIISDIFDDFAALHPNVIFKNHIFTLKQIEELLLLNGIDIAISEVYPYIISDGWEKLIDDELLAVIPEDHRLKDKSFLTFSDFVNENIFIYPAHSYVRNKMESLFYFNGIFPHIFYEDDNPTKVLSNMMRSGGISFISKTLLYHVYHIADDSAQNKELFNHIRLIKIQSPLCSWQIGYKTSKQQTDPSLITEFIACAKALYLKRSMEIDNIVESLTINI